MENRRKFIKESLVAVGAVLSAGPVLALEQYSNKKARYHFKVSLAEWSLHKTIFSGKMTNLDFPEVVKKQFGFDAVEYVNGFFKDKANDMAYLGQLKARCEDNGVKSVLIMVDEEGYLSDNDDQIREKAIENHYKWIEASKYLGGHAIRVNLFGSGNENEWHAASVKSLIKLTEFADKMDMNILAENHGGLSSNARLMSNVIKEVGHKRCGTLVDFANFCTKREKGDLFESPCIEWYDKYKGVEELLPFVKGVSAKTYSFLKNGDESTIDYLRMLKQVKAAGYQGYVGIEYEGTTLSEEQGIKYSKRLVESIQRKIC